MSDPIQVQVLQFYLIVVPQPPEEAMCGRREPAHMEVDKKDVVAIRRLWLGSPSRPGTSHMLVALLHRRSTCLMRPSRHRCYTSEQPHNTVLTGAVIWGSQVTAQAGEKSEGLDNGGGAKKRR